MLNQAAHKWHRAGGNWCSRSSPVPIGRELRKLLRFKIFNQIDADGSGNLSFDELVQCVETLAELPDATKTQRKLDNARGPWNLSLPESTDP